MGRHRSSIKEEDTLEMNWLPSKARSIPGVHERVSCCVRSQSGFQTGYICYSGLPISFGLLSNAKKDAIPKYSDCLFGCLHSPSFPALKFAACGDKALELQSATSTQYLSLTCDDALITYYDHTNRNLLLPLSQQRSHHIHTGSDDHKVMLAVICLRTSSPSWDINGRYILRKPC